MPKHIQEQQFSFRPTRPLLQDILIHSCVMKYKGIPIDSISVFKTPAIYLQLTSLLIADIFAWLKSFIVRRILPILVLTTLWLMVSNIDALQTIEDICYFVAYWILLGVASSIGLGTGLHTFVLYLGPHIAKVALAATHCGHLPHMLPSRWNFSHFSDCQESSLNQLIGLFGILLAVQIESFLWGLGTALGELPPYFVAKKAAETRAQLKRMNDTAEGHPQIIDTAQKTLIEQQHKVHHLSNEQIEQVLQLKRKPNLTLMERAKIIIYDNMQKYGFWTILTCASIPNPLFDLAGITCGHFRIPFKTFFTATFFGKAIIKVHIQMIFVITIARKESLDFIINCIQWFSHNLAESVRNSLQEQKKILYEPSRFSENKPWFAKCWDLFIIGMVAYFLKSILDAQVQQRALTLKDKRID